MRYPAYPQYTDSQVEWIGYIPGHWIVSRVKFVAEINPSKNQARSLPENQMVTFLPMETIGENGELDTSKSKPLSEVLNGYTYLAEGDVIIAKITPCFENGKGAIASGLLNGIAFATTEVIPLRCKNSHNNKFLYYLLNSQPFRGYAEGSMYGAGGQKRVSDNFVANYKFSLPPIEEQRQIAAFLDRETAVIDTLIAKQEELIRLLQEKRQAVISHAVTKGLNPHAPMKDSGIEWLGQIPAHWTISPLNYLTNQVTVGIVVTPAKYYEDSGVPCIRSLNVKPGYILKENFVYISEESNHLHSKSKLNAGDVVVVRTGQPGTTAVIDSDLDGCNCIDLIIIRKSRLFVSKFLEYQMNSAITKIQVAAGSDGAIQQHFNVEVAKALKIFVPPIEEQGEIIDFLNVQIEQYDNLINRASHAIELLKERRTALISAAVTGKIDVRHASPQGTPS